MVEVSRTIYPSDRKPPRISQGGVMAALVVAALLMSACGARSERDQAYAALNAGLRAQSAGQLSTAAEQYRKAIAHDPTNKYAYYNLGLVNQLSGQSEAAEQNYRAAIQLDPNFVAALYNLAIIRAGAAPQEAEQLYRHVISFQPNDPAPHLNLGFLLRSMNRIDEARAEFATVMLLDPAFTSHIPVEFRTTKAKPAPAAPAPAAKGAGK
jgi:tetratricopeptide (TPR) repeat protein